MLNLSKPQASSLDPLLLAALFMAGGPVLAHHAFSAEFDAKAPVTLEGSGDQGRVDQPPRLDSHGSHPAGRQEGDLDGRGRDAQYPPARRHLARLHESGTEIVVAGFKAKDGRLRANGRDITFPDGRTLFMGSSGTGAPKDGRDPTIGPSRKGSHDDEPDARRLCRSQRVRPRLRPRGLRAIHTADSQAYRAPRTPDGTPDLNGIWQAINTANWNIEAHDARQGPVFALGAAFSVPPGLGVVEGDEIPYMPEALAKRNENAANWMTPIRR